MVKGSQMSLARCILSGTLALFWLSVILGTVQGEMADEDLEITYDREDVVLRPGGETTLTFTLTNHGEEPMDVAFAFVSVDAPRHSEGYFSTVLTTLQPGASKENLLVVRSHAQKRDEPDVSNFVVNIFWGADITLDDDQQPIENTVDGVWEHEFEVQHEAEPGLSLVASVVALAVVLVIALIVLYPAWTGHKDPD